MWQSEKSDIESEKNFTDELEGLESDPGKIDSGFLSGVNIGVNGVVDEIESDIKNLSDKKEEGGNYSCRKTIEDQMRVDSGIVEVSFCETALSQLSLKSSKINCLKGKVQSEPTVELAPINNPLLETSRDRGSNVDVNNEETLQREINARNFLRLHYSQDEDGDTQLHIAIVQGFHEVALSLIRMAPHPSLFDCLNQKHQSPLHLAVLTHQPIIVRHLILAGADPSLRNSDGNTALHLASASGDLPCAKALTNPLLITERTYLISGRQAPRIPQDLEQPNYEGETCLHSAVVAGNTEIVRLLIGVGANLETKERLGGRTALHLAIECRRQGVTSLLLNECHPHLDALTYGGLTPYEIASCLDSQLAKELIRLGATEPGNDYMETNEDITKIPQLWSVGLRA